MIRLLLLLSLLIFMTACATIDPKERPKDASELIGVVSGDPANARNELSRAFGDSNDFLAMESAAKAAVSVAVSDKLTLIVPSSKEFRLGDCVRLFVDPLYKTLVTTTSNPDMTMPVGSALIEKRPCQ